MMYGTEIIIQFLRAHSEVKVFAVAGATNDGGLGDSNLGWIIVELFGEAVVSFLQLHLYFSYI